MSDSISVHRVPNKVGGHHVGRIGGDDLDTALDVAR
jgi:hypothetical protein